MPGHAVSPVLQLEPKLRLLVVASSWPHVVGNYEAANVVVHAIMSELVKTGEFDIQFLFVNTEPRDISIAAQPEINALKNAGVRFLEPLIIENISLRRRPVAFLKSFLNPELMLRGYGASKTAQGRLQKEPVDAVLSIWSEIGNNIICDYPALRFSYHGNPDHKVLWAQFEMQRLVGVQPTGLTGIIKKIQRALTTILLERAHLAALRRFEFVSNVAANDAHYYAKKGVSSFYLQNMWPVLPPKDWQERRDKLEILNPGKIIGSVGNLSATGNSFGFIALGQEVLPALKRVMADRPFDIHIYGGRAPKDFIQPLLMDPHVHIRGFVDDLDSEILSAPVFLIANNHHEFKVGHTRFLHAWSLGACVVAFADCVEAMPEIEHGKNALLGRTADEVAHWIAVALSDRELRRRIGNGGVDTLKNSYQPAAITRKLADLMQNACQSGKNTSPV